MICEATDKRAWQLRRKSCSEGMEVMESAVAILAVKIQLACKSVTSLVRLPDSCWLYAPPFREA